MLNLSIIIPAYNDIRLKECLQSIDEDVEIVIVLNGATEEVKKIAYSYNSVVKIFELSEPNLAKAYNYGIENSTKDNVLIMDSDCIFISKTIIKLYKLLEKAPLSKGRILFLFNSKLGKIIARFRHIHTNGKNAYSPPLAFRKEILKDIGNYYFDEKLVWTEDYDFNIRVSSANLLILYDSTARITHPELSLKEDLKSSFNYGTGHSRGVFFNKKGYNVPKKDIKIFASAFKSIGKKYGYATAIYFLIWQIAFLVGYKKENSKLRGK
ncbi:MAG: glycosyltransferase [Defluviitaleaceae bacterium]|nr:glycosyltransferase [Defluviitaleaceae bacterium]